VEVAALLAFSKKPHKKGEVPLISVAELAFPPSISFATVSGTLLALTIPLAYTVGVFAFLPSYHIIAAECLHSF
jgi:hypothetical protein